MSGATAEPEQPADLILIKVNFTPFISDAPLFIALGS